MAEIHQVECTRVKAERLGEVALTYVRNGNARAAYWYAMHAAHQAGFCCDSDSPVATSSKTLAGAV